jgi:arylsulfatase A-like enzyme
VVILWDTTRADRLSAYGYPRKTTPWLESVAARGVLFEQCRAPAPWTVPSHASIFTGLIPRHHGAVDMQSPLAPTHYTLAERLRDAGYDTVLLSCNASVGGDINGLGQGFDTIRVVPMETQRAPSADDAAEILDGLLKEKAKDPRRAGKPLFLFINLMEPHLPYDPPAELERPWRPAGATEEEVGRAKRIKLPWDMAHNLGVRTLDAGTLAILRGLYDAEILRMDDPCVRMERMLDAAGVLGDASDAVFVVTADHGENLGEHGLLDHKLSTAEALLHVPLVIRWPGRLEGGRRVKEQVRLQDLFPTLLEAAGLAPPGGTPHAASLVSAPLAGRWQVSEFPPPLSYLDYMHQTPPFAGLPEEIYEPMHTGILAVTAPQEGGRRLKWEGRWRLASNGETTALPERLYDLAADPGEDHDLLGGKEPAPADLAAAKALAKVAEEWTAPPGSPPR